MKEKLIKQQKNKQKQKRTKENRRYSEMVKAKGFAAHLSFQLSFLFFPANMYSFFNF